MKSTFPAGLLATALLAASPLAFAGGPAAVAAAAPVPVQATATIPAEQAAQKADPRFAAYCLHDTGSVIVAMQNRRAERIARANGTAPKLRCTGMGVALKVNADGVPVPVQEG